MSSQDRDRGVTTNNRSRDDENVLASAGVAVGLKSYQHPVVAGDPSFTMVEAKFKHDLDKSKDEVEKAKAKLEKAEAKLEKAEAKRAQNEVELETVQSERSVALANKGRGSEEFALAEQNVTRCTHKFDDAQQGVRYAQQGVHDAQQGVHDARRLVTIAIDLLQALSRRYLGTFLCPQSSFAHRIFWILFKIIVVTVFMYLLATTSCLLCIGRFVSYNDFESYVFNLFRIADQKYCFCDLFIHFFFFQQSPWLRMLLLLRV
jgi:hypothetical protein